MRSTQQALAFNQHLVVVLYHGVQVTVIQSDVGRDYFILVGLVKNVALQVVNQTDLNFVFSVGTFVACLFCGCLAGIGRDVNHSCPLLEAGQLAFGVPNSLLMMRIRSSINSAVLAATSFLSLLPSSL